MNTLSNAPYSFLKYAAGRVGETADAQGNPKTSSIQRGATQGSNETGAERASQPGVAERYASGAF